MKTQTLGHFGEELICKYLKNNNYKIINHNHRLGRLEIDIIATKAGRLYFFEIKTRIKNKESIKEIPLQKSQANNLKKAARRYAATHRINLELIHFDLIIVLLDRQKNIATIKRYENIF